MSACTSRSTPRSATTNGDRSPRPRAPPASSTISAIFHPDVATTRQRAHPDAVEAELRAQIETAYAAGIDVTHLDAHMGCALSPEFCDIYIRLGLEYRLPILLTSTIAAYTPNDNLVGVTEAAHRKGVDKARACRLRDLRRRAADHLGPAALEAGRAGLRAIIESVKDGLTFFCLHFNAPGELELIEPRSAYIRTEEYDLFRSEGFRVLAAGAGSRHHRHEAAARRTAREAAGRERQFAPGKRP